MLLIKNYLSPKLSPESLKATRSWMKRFEGDLNKKIDNESQKTLKNGDKAIEEVASDLTCLKETFGLDDFLMENIFTLGEDFLKQKEFYFAVCIFSVLTFLDPLSPDSALSLGL